MMHFWCSFDAVLMQFWNYIILMHFWCSFKGFWCTFDAVSKLHQNCIESASCFLWIFSIFLEKMLKCPKKIWCTFDVISKLHQNCIKSESCFLSIFSNILRKILPELHKYLFQYIFLDFSHVSTLSFTIPPSTVTVWFWHSSSWKFTGISSSTSFLTSHM